MAICDIVIFNPGARKISASLTKKACRPNQALQLEKVFSICYLDSNGTL